jgi:ATP-binding cassette subfamily F protein uup
VGGYSDWVRQRPAAEAVAAPRPTKRASSVAAPTAAAPRPAKKRGLSYKEKQELAELPDRIDTTEREREMLYASLSDPAFLRDGAAVAKAKARLTAIEIELAELTERWEALETIAGG